jgi:hypothetical protein
MIRYDFANDLMDQIAQIIGKYSTEGKIAFVKRRRQPDEYVEHRFEYKHFNLPYRIISLTNSMIVHSYFYEVDEYYFASKQKYSSEKVEQNLRQIEERNSNQEELECDAKEFLEGFVINLVNFYQRILTKVREMDELQGIVDEEKILINYLNFYQDIVQSSTHQLEIGTGITFPKEVADLFTKVLIRFIKMRLDLLNPQLKVPVEEDLNIKVESNLKLIWKGNQKELLELIIELQKKGWIEPLQRGQFNKAAKSICSLFDLSSTKRNPKSDEVASFGQLLKGTINDGERGYDYGKNYLTKFDKVTPNPLLD